MVYKYIVPKHERKKYGGKKVLYCKTIDKIPIENIKKSIIYKIKILNIDTNKITVVAESELKKLNAFDRIKMIFIKEK